jgi:hypothetical protein
MSADEDPRKEDVQESGAKGPDNEGMISSGDGEREASSTNDERQQSSLTSSGLLSWLGPRTRKITAAVGLPTMAIVIGLIADLHVFVGGVVEDYMEGRAHERIEATVRGHYEAIGAGDYDRAYSYFGSVMRNVVGAEGWIEARKNEYCPVVHPHGADVKDVRVSEVNGDKAVATADVRFKHTCGESHWIFAWRLNNESDGWKLASQIPEATHALYNTVPFLEPYDNTGITKSDVSGESQQDKLESVKASATAEPGEDASGKLFTYEPANAVDGKPYTAWQVAGDGKNQWILLEYEEPMKVSRVGIIPGYDKVDPEDDTDRFYQMYVVREARIEFSDGSRHLADFRRDREMQFVDVPDTETTSVRITILDTYPPQLRHPNGSSYSALLGKSAISEVKVEGP